MDAILSDIHSNIEALTAVLEDIQWHDIDRVICLGDIVGYGPNPIECLDLAMKFDISILGNHDQGVLFDPEGMNEKAERAIFWTRDQLEKSADPKAADRWTFLSERPRSWRDGNFLFVHGSARNPLNEYVFPEDVYNPHKLPRIFQLVEKYVFQGHTHVPGVFTDDFRFRSPSEVNHRYRLDGRKTMVNVGSVGQPRDGDDRACYVIFDRKRLDVHFRRVDYDRETTISKIRDNPDLFG